MKIYYVIKIFIPRWIQIFLRRKIVKFKLRYCKHIWPIDKSCARSDRNMRWPKDKRFVFLLRHDIESIEGLNKCDKLVEIEKKYGFRSSFNFVPLDYKVSDGFRNSLTIDGFEVGVHGLHHDGRLYDNEKSFKIKAKQINEILAQWESVGFYSPSAHHNLKWLLELNIKYDSSTFDTDPFEPQPDGVKTIFPVMVENKNSSKKYVELPYTLPQDFTLFILMEEKNIEVWKKKVDWIAKNNGMVFLNTHPDYMYFRGEKLKKYHYSAEQYIKFLEFMKENYQGQYVHLLPKELASYCLKRENENLFNKIIY
jgi:hypothetical protein